MKKEYEKPTIKMDALHFCDVLNVSPNLDDKNYLREDWFSL